MAVVAPWPEMGKLAGALGDGPTGYGIARERHWKIEKETTNPTKHLTKTRSGRKRAARRQLGLGDVASTQRGDCGLERDGERHGVGSYYLWPGEPWEA